MVCVRETRVCRYSSNGPTWFVVGLWIECCHSVSQPCTPILEALRYMEGRASRQMTSSPYPYPNPSWHLAYTGSHLKPEMTKREDLFATGPTLPQWCSASRLLRSSPQTWSNALKFCWSKNALCLNIYIYNYIQYIVNKLIHKQELRVFHTPKQPQPPIGIHVSNVTSHTFWIFKPGVTCFKQCLCVGLSNCALGCSSASTWGVIASPASWSWWSTNV